MVMEVSIPMVTIMQGKVILVGHNPHHTTKEIMLIDTNHMLHGVQEVMVLDKTTVVLEDVKV